MQSELSNVISMIETLKGKVDKQETAIQEMAEELKEKDKKIKIHGDILHQLLGGLFHHEKQGCTLDEMIAMLFQDSCITAFSKNDPDYYCELPTTRQGDELEKRLDEMDTKLQQIGALFPPNKISQERVKRSFDLCGNE